MVCYSIFLIPFYLTFEDNVTTKSRHVWNVLFSFLKRKPTQVERVAILSTLVKAFFLPLMLVWLVGHIASIYSHGTFYLSKGLFFPNGYWMLFNIIFLVDVTFFTLGYALEHPKLNNEIRSVDPWVTGWFIALICYPPFNNVSNQMLSWHSSDYPQFNSSWAQYTAGIAILLLLSIYAWASVSLNLKASNLTNRGIVSSGPYALVRHPAYCTKTLAWWIGSLPILSSKWDLGLAAFLYGVFSVAGWSVVYYLRAVTEERHLMLDSDYQHYCKRVTRQFFPKLTAKRAEH